MSKLLYKGGPLITLKSEEFVLDALHNCWSKDAYKYVEMFEQLFKASVNRGYCVMTTSCTSAIHIALAAIGIGKGDKVIVPELTWTATAEPVIWLGAKPVFCDIKEDTWCIDPERAKEMVKYDKNIKAVIAVDLFGNMPDYKEFTGIGIPIIEDSAEAFGSSLKGRKAGSFGVISTFSFHRSKTIPIGEGGVAVTDDPVLYDKLYGLRDHGRQRGDSGGAYHNHRIGYKYVPTNMQAAFGCSQLLEHEELVRKQIQIANWYFTMLESITGVDSFTPTTEGVINSFWSPAVRLEEGIESEEVCNMMNKEGFSVRPCFYPLSSLPAYSGHVGGAEKETNPVAYRIHKNIINLPVSYQMTIREIEDICISLQQVIAKILGRK